MKIDLQDKVAVVTGGASGISYAIGTALGLAGCRVWLADLNDDGGRKAASELAGKGIVAKFHHLDVCDESSVESLMKDIYDEEKRIDILFNGAGIRNNKALLDLSVKDWDRLLDINLRGVFLCSKEAAKFMIRNEYGRIINVVSGLAGGAAGDGDYAVSKAGVLALSKSFAAELLRLKHNVTINAIAPGPTDTPLFRVGRAAEDFERRKLLGAISNPSDMADAILFLASPEGGIVSGQVIGHRNNLFNIPSSLREAEK